MVRRLPLRSLTGRICSTPPVGFSGVRFPIMMFWPCRAAFAKCRGGGLRAFHFYTGVPLPGKDPRSHDFWRSKLRRQDHQGVRVFSRPLRYRAMGDGEEKAEEKGVDVRIAVDIIRAVLREECDVALIFSQDQDFSEVGKEVWKIAREQRRWIKIAALFRPTATPNPTAALKAFAA